MSAIKANQVLNLDGDRIGSVVVDSIANMKNLNPEIEANATVELLGYYSKGDSGGGTFYWDSTSIEDDNGGTIIEATGVVDGRWIRNYSGAVNVKWFVATGDNNPATATNFEAAFNYCMTNLRELFLPKGTYNVSETNMSSINGLGISITGEGRGSSIVKTSSIADDYIFDMSNTTPDNSSFFYLSNVSLGGNEDVLGTFTGKSKALIIHNIDQVKLSNVAFSKFDIVITAGNSYSNKIEHCRFGSSNVGIRTNVVDGYFQNNTIDTCEFVDFWNASTSNPIDSSGGVGSFNYNTIINCNFESSGTMGTLDLSESSYNNLIACRFERMNHRVSDWVVVGSNNTLTNCSFHMRGGTVDTGTGYAPTMTGDRTPYTALRVIGDGNLIELGHLTPYYNGVIMSSTSKNNTFNYTDYEQSAQNSQTGNFYTDYGFNNKVIRRNTNRANVLLNSEDFSSFTLGTGVGKVQMNSAQDRAWGHDKNGRAYQINTAAAVTAEKKLSYSYYNYVGQSFVFSTYIFCEVDNIIGLAIAGKNTCYSEIPANKWVRLSIALTANSTGAVNFDIINDLGIHEAFYVNAPQINRFVYGNELHMDSAPIMPTKYIPTAGEITTRNNADTSQYAASAPVSGLASSGDIIYSLAPATLGYAGWIASQTGDTYTVTSAVMWRKFGAIV